MLTLQRSNCGSFIRSPLGSFGNKRLASDEEEEPQITTYVLLYDWNSKSRAATIFADGSWSYSSMCHTCPRSFSHGMGLKYKVGGAWGDGWYYDDSTGNPFNQSILGYPNNILWYLSSGASAPPGDLFTYCYRKPGTSPISIGETYSKPSAIYLKPPYSFDALAQGWRIFGGCAFGETIRKNKDVLESIGPNGFYQYTRYSGNGFVDGVYPATSVHWDYTDEFGDRHMGALGFDTTPYVTSAHVAAATSNIALGHSAVGVL
jgi:hypothetical protein